MANDRSLEAFARNYSGMSERWKLLRAEQELKRERTKSRMEISQVEAPMTEFEHAREMVRQLQRAADRGCIVPHDEIFPVIYRLP